MSEVSDDRVRNIRAWNAARAGSLSGADATVAICDELLELRALFAWLQNAKGQLSIQPDIFRELPYRWHGSDGTVLSANNLIGLIEAARGVSKS